MAKKKMCIANFNTVFLKDDKEYPLLDYFDSIVMPALTCGKIIKSNGASFFFADVKVMEDADGEYILSGILIKDTVLEVKYNWNYQEGRLKDKKGKYQSSPYSLFLIYLKNHRMLLVRDQQGSPSLANFRTTAKSLLETYVKKENRNLEKENRELLPIPLVNVIGISSGGNIRNTLLNVEKISKLLLRFYPLNGDGDIDMQDIFNGISNVRHYVKASTGGISLNSPQDKEKVADLIDELNGTMEPVVWVRYPESKVDSKITMDLIVENTEISVPDDDTKENVSLIVSEGKRNGKINFTSAENKKIYERNRNKIIPFLKND